MSLKGKVVYIFLSCTLSIIFVNRKSIVALVAAIFLLFICYRKIGKQFAIIMSCFFLFFNFHKTVKIDESLNETYVDDTFQVEDVKPSYIIIKKESKYIVYLDDTSELKKGNVLHIKGTYKLVSEDLDIDVFDFSEYLNNQRIFYEIEIVDLKIINDKQNLQTSIIDMLTLNLSSESYTMTKMLLFNDKYSSLENYNNLVEISAVHLFVVSGFHISFLITLIKKIFKKSEKIGVIVSFVFTGFYVWLLSFSIGALRAFISYFIIMFSNKKLNQLDGVAIAGIITLLIEPLNIFNYSFIMSYLITFVIVLFSKTLKKQNKILQPFILSIICFITMIPIQLQLNNKLNMLSILSNVLLGYVVTIIFILCIIGMALSVLNGNIFGVIYKMFYEMVDKLSNIKSTLIFGTMHPVIIALFYFLLLCLFVFIEKKKVKQTYTFIVIIACMLLALYNRQYFLFYQQVTFLNVYQGDCCIIQDSFSGKTMLIDTGGLLYYDVATNKIIPYLHNHGIRKVDVVVISHDDYDHNGALDSLKKQIKIDKIIHGKADTVNMGKIKLKNLNIYYDDYSSENDQSIVLYGEICGYNFLFTGDISSEVEKRIVKDNPNLSVDVLKVSHHGSNTSTCKEFVEAIKPNYAIISVGNNYYGHPSTTVLETLNDYEVSVYRTDINGSIRFKGKIFDFCFIDTAK